MQNAGAVVYLGALLMNKLGILHAHYIPTALLKGLDELYAIIVPEFYPDLNNEYYGAIEYFTDLEDCLHYESNFYECRKVFYSIENLNMLRDLKKLKLYNSLGLLGIQLFHNSDNRYFKASQGLTEEGKILLNEILDLNMFLDLSHLRDEAILDIMKYFSGRLVISHCACVDFHSERENRSNALRLKTLEMAVKRGAYIGLAFVNDIIAKTSNCTEDSNIINDIVNQIIELSKNLNSDNICFGQDFFSVRYFSQVYKTQLIIPKTLYNIEGYNFIEQMLRANGLEQSCIDKIFYKNVQTFLQTSVSSKTLSRIL